MDALNATAVIEDYPDPTMVDPDYFSDNDYGLLNAALFVQQNPGYVWNSSDKGDNLSAVAEVSTAYRSGYSQAWLPDGDSQIFRFYAFGPLGLKDYGSATLCCKI